MSSNFNAPQTPQQALASSLTSPAMETANNGAAIACDIAEEGRFGVDDVYHEGKTSIHCRVETICNSLM
eukprot:13742486-Ditylum_brightwellii.AAC.1